MVQSKLFKRVSFVSLGCAKNLVDSEKMLGQLAEAGCVITNEEDADVIVINTCGFLDASRVEADEVIREATQRKKKGGAERVVVAGCLVQRDKESILDRIEGIDALVGVNNRDDIVRAVLGSGEPRPLARADIPLVVRPRGLKSAARPTDIYLADYHPFVQLDTARLRLTPRHYAYLRISEGCDQKCTFCTIPSIRGRMHCKPPSIVLDEARELVSDGAVEISLIGQDTTSYGLGEESIEGGLASLLRQLNQVDGLAWVRLMYVYPSVLSDEILDAIAESEHVCNYIDVPLQHINNRILKSMHRRIDRAATERLLDRIRDRIPGVAIRTTLIAGFPGETEAEFEELLHFVQAFRFDALGVFSYSLEPETPAGRMKEQLPERVKQGRVDALMTAQQEVAFALAEERIGTVFDVMVDEIHGRRTVHARHQGQAPHVDSVTVVHDCDAKPGSFMSVRCTGRADYDLISAHSGTVDRVECMKPALNLPNQITLGRLILAIVFIVLLSQYSQRSPQVWKLDLAWILFVVAAATDFLDGYIARKYSMITPLGRVLDPLVDKVLVCGAFVLFTGSEFVDQAGRNVTGVSAWMTVVIVGRELLVTGLRGFNESMGKSFGSSLHGKLKMWMQSIAVPVILFVVAREHTVGMGAVGAWIKSGLVWLTVLVTALSMIQYLFRSRYILEESAPA